MAADAAERSGQESQAEPVVEGRSLGVDVETRQLGGLFVVKRARRIAVRLLYKEESEEQRVLFPLAGDEYEEGTFGFTFFNVERTQLTVCVTHVDMEDSGIVFVGNDNHCMTLDITYTPESQGWLPVGLERRVDQFVVVFQSVRDPVVTFIDEVEFTLSGFVCAQELVIEPIVTMATTEYLEENLRRVRYQLPSTPVNGDLTCNLKSFVNDGEVDPFNTTVPVGARARSVQIQSCRAGGEFTFALEDNVCLLEATYVPRETIEHPLVVRSLTLARKSSEDDEFVQTIEPLQALTTSPRRWTIQEPPGGIYYGCAVLRIDDTPCWDVSGPARGEVQVPNWLAPVDVLREPSRLHWPAFGYWEDDSNRVWSNSAYNADHGHPAFSTDGSFLAIVWEARLEDAPQSDAEEDGFVRFFDGDSYEPISPAYSIIEMFGLDQNTGITNPDIIPLYDRTFLIVFGMDGQAAMFEMGLRGPKTDIVIVSDDLPQSRSRRVWPEAKTLRDAPDHLSRAFAVSWVHEMRFQSRLLVRVYADTTKPISPSHEVVSGLTQGQKYRLRFDVAYRADLDSIIGAGTFSRSESTSPQSEASVRFFAVDLTNGTLLTSPIHPLGNLSCGKIESFVQTQQVTLLSSGAFLAGWSEQDEALKRDLLVREAQLNFPSVLFEAPSDDFWRRPTIKVSNDTLSFQKSTMAYVTIDGARTLMLGLSSEDEDEAGLELDLLVISEARRRTDLIEIPGGAARPVFAVSPNEDKLVVVTEKGGSVFVNVATFFTDGDREDLDGEP